MTQYHLNFIKYIIHMYGLLISLRGIISKYSKVKYCFMSHQLIYGYIRTDDDNDDEIDRNLDLHFKDKGSFTSDTT